MKRLKSVLCMSAGAALLLASASSAEAQIQRVTDSGRNSINFNLGYFSVKPEDSRVDGDVLIADLTSAESLFFDVKDFNNATFGGEFLFGVSEYIDAGVGVGFYQRTVPSIYADFTDDNGNEIEQDLKLRVVPITATVRFLPAGRGGVEPYVGAGIGIFPWRYSEVGEFVDTNDFSIFPARFIADGTATGAVILGGVRFPVADVWTIGGEVKWQKAEGKIDMAETELLGNKIDLGGWNVNFTFGLKF